MSDSAVDLLSICVKLTCDQGLVWEHGDGLNIVYQYVFRCEC